MAKGLENKGWNALYIENHDKPRIVSTWGDDKQYWRESATALGRCISLCTVHRLFIKAKKLV